MIRYITNEPKLDVTEGNVKAGYGVTAHGDPNTDVTAVLNLPLIADTMAVRARDLRRSARRLHRQRAGDVHAQGHRHRHPLRELSGRSTASARTACRTTAIACRPAARSSTTTASSATPSTRSTYQGIRVEVLYKFNDDWDVLLTQSYQDMDSQGVFYQQPQCLGWRAAAAARGHAVQPGLRQGQVREHGVDGRTASSADLKAVYTGGYLVRNVDQVGDYTNYARGVYADYYQCYGPGVRRRRCRRRASRRAPPGTRSSTTRTSSTNSA